MATLPPGFWLATAQSILIHLLISAIIAFSSHSSPARPVAFASIVALTLSLQGIAARWSRTGYHLAATGFHLCPWVTVSIALDLFFFTRVTYAEHIEWLSRSQKNKNMNISPSLTHRLLWALVMPVNYRRIGTKWQISHIPPFDVETPSSIPTRTGFLIHRLLTSIIAFSVVYSLVAGSTRSANVGVGEYPTGTVQKNMLDAYDLSLPTLQTRLSLTACFIITLFISQAAWSNAVSFIAVLFRLSPPQNWPPIQGSVLEAYTVRRFWSHTWHQAFRAFLSPLADFLTFSVLRLSPKTVMSRYTRYVICFFHSALIHLAFDVGRGMTYPHWPSSLPVPSQTGAPVEVQSGALLFFTVQPLAFAIEEAVQVLVNRCGFLTKEGDGHVRRFIGYVWVAAWCTLTWPVWVFPQGMLILQKRMFTAISDGLRT
ncbi:membrane bound O-acyl transferase family-domain-containing protein [Aspergillus falconensis]